MRSSPNGVLTPPSSLLLTLLLILSGSWGGLAAQDSQDALPMSGNTAAQEHVLAGLDFAFNVTPVQAARHFEMALEADPDFGLARVLHGWWAPGLSGAERSAAIGEGLGMMEGAEPAEVMLAAAARSFMAGEAALGSRAFVALSDAYPGVGWLAYWATVTRGARGDETAQVEAMESMTERFPDFAPAHNALAYAYRAQGDRAGAMRAIREYMRLAASDHPNAHDSYAELLQWEGRYDEALRHYGHAMEMDPGYAAAYTGAAEVHWLMGNHEEAAELLEQAIEPAAGTAAKVTAHRELAHVHLMQGQLDEGMRILTAAAQLAEAADNGGLAGLVHEEIAMAEAVLGDDGAVEGHLLRAAELRGNSPPVHNALAAMAWAAADRPDRVRMRAEALLGADMSLSWQAAGHMAMGFADIEEEEWESGIRHLGMADPGNPSTRAALAWALEQSGQEIQAESIRNELRAERQINLANPYFAYAFMRMNN